jgi:glycosyltransferase involved in cell wall biosynthesis
MHVIIPTRNRANTLQWSLRTALNQHYQPYTIWVSDNCSTDNTAEVIAAEKDPRIQYIRPETPLSMSSHWEFALDHIREGYVMILGDDDGLYADAVGHAARLLKQHSAVAIRWGYAPYLWPGIGNIYFHPVHDTVGFQSTQSVLEQVRNDVGKIRMLPGFYWGFVDIAVYKKIKARDGMFFNSSIPDYYSASVLSGEIERFLYTEAALSIGGTSPKSLGVSFVAHEKEKEGGRKEFFTQLDKPVHPKIVFGKDGITALADPYLHASDRSTNLPELNISAMLEKSLRLVAGGASKEKYDETVLVLKEIAQRNKLNSIIDRLIALNPYAGIDSTTRKGSYSIGLNAIRFFPQDYGFTNVYEVSMLGSQFQKNLKFTGSFRQNKVTFLLSRIKGILFVTWVALFTSQRKYLLRRYLYSFIGR